MKWLHPREFHSDHRVLGLIVEHGYEGYGILMALFERMLSDDEVRLKGGLKVAALAIRASYDVVERVVEECISLNLLARDENGEVYSPDMYADLEAYRSKTEKMREGGLRGVQARLKPGLKGGSRVAQGWHEGRHKGGLRVACNEMLCSVNEDQGTEIVLGSSIGSSPDVGGAGGETQAEPTQNEPPPVDQPSLPTPLEPSKTPRAIKAEPLVPGCNYFRMSAAEREKVERWYRKNELPPELLNLAILQVDAWMDAGSKAAAVKARGSPTHYRQLTAAWVIENASKILRSKQNGTRNGHGQFLNEAEKKQNFFADLERKMTGENENGRVRNGEIFETNFTVMAEPESD